MQGRDAHAAADTRMNKVKLSVVMLIAMVKLDTSAEGVSFLHDPTIVRIISTDVLWNGNTSSSGAWRPSSHVLSRQVLEQLTG